METYDNHTTDTGAALEAGQSLALAQQKPQTIGENGIPFLVNASGEAKSLEHLLARPFRHKAKPVFIDAESFITYVNLYKVAGATLIFSKIDTNGGSFHAALDIAISGATSWNDHSAIFKLTTTPDWAAWMANNKKWMSQEDFVLFVETQRHVFMEPTSATMLEIAMSLEATVKGNYKSAFRAQNGDRTLVLDMTTDATFGKGEAKIEVPQEITIALAPFEGQNPYTTGAFLRFRPTAEGVKFQYELQRPEETIRNSAQEARERIAAETSLVVLNGTLAAN